MINPVTPWTATVQADIVNGAVLFETALSQYKFVIYNAGDSIWLTAEWPDAGRMAFRLAFGMNSDFEKTSVERNPENIVVTALTRLANYTITISFPQSSPAMFRYTTTFKTAFPLLIPYWPRDIVPLTTDGRVENTSGIIHVKQEGTRSGNLFFSTTRPKRGSVFYFQNLTAMSPYCQVSETTVRESVGGEWPEIGFQFPVNKTKPIPAGTEYTISDAFVILQEDIFEKASQITAAFLNNLAEVYKYIPKPVPVYQDWHAIADNVLNDLHRNKACWTMVKDSSFLTAYAGDYDTPAEIMVQLAVLLPLHEYLEWSGREHPLFDDLNKGLSDFYDHRLQSVVRWHPDRVDNLDKSEEQKQDMVMDSWYLHHPMLNLSRLAHRGDKTAEKLFLDSVDYVIKVAQHFKYEWPVFYKMTTLEVIKAETSPGKGGEKDVPGSYAHIMIMAYKYTGEKRFLNEAVKALKSLEGLGFDIFYQANNTAFTAGALAELYIETKDQKYLDLSYSCLAGVFKNVQLWECDYGYGKNFPTFFSVFPLNDAPYTAAYEEFEVFAALHHYMEVTQGLDILPSLKVLIPEFIKYTVGRIAYYYPPLLPAEMIDQEVKTGEIQKELWVPLEDIHDGWEKSGGVGQEVYGAGMPFGIIPRQYFMIEDLKTFAFINYPALKFRHGKKTVSFHVGGDPHYNAQLFFPKLSKAKLAAVKVEVKNKSSYQRVQPDKEGHFELAGGSMVRISW